MILRRSLLALAGSLPLAGLLGRRAPAALDRAAVESLQENWRDLLPPGADVATELAPLDKSAQAWRRELGPPAYHILFEEGTERPFSSPLNEEKRDGVFVCAACRLPLFTSAMKYDSGTGWPSFFTHIPGHVGTKADYKLVWPRTEYHCIKCGGHQGHLFEDGPPPTGERWCNNGLALSFIAKA